MPNKSNLPTNRRLRTVFRFGTVCANDSASARRSRLGARKMRPLLDRNEEKNILDADRFCARAQRVTDRALPDDDRGFAFSPSVSRRCAPMPVQSIHSGVRLEKSHFLSLSIGDENAC